MDGQDIDLVHAAVTGKSAFVHADGRVESRTELFETTTASGLPAARTAGHTLYVRWGDWLQVGAMLAYLGLRVAGRIRRDDRT